MEGYPHAVWNDGEVSFWVTSDGEDFEYVEDALDHEQELQQKQGQLAEVLVQKLADELADSKKPEWPKHDHGVWITSNGGHWSYKENAEVAQKVINGVFPLNMFPVTTPKGWLTSDVAFFDADHFEQAEEHQADLFPECKTCGEKDSTVSDLLDGNCAGCNAQLVVADLQNWEKDSASEVNCTAQHLDLPVVCGKCGQFADQPLAGWWGCKNCDFMRESGTLVKAEYKHAYAAPGGVKLYKFWWALKGGSPPPKKYHVAEPDIAPDDVPRVRTVWNLVTMGSADKPQGQAGKDWWNESCFQNVPELPGEKSYARMIHFLSMFDPKQTVRISGFVSAYEAHPSNGRKFVFCGRAARAIEWARKAIPLA